MNERPRTVSAVVLPPVPEAPGWSRCATCSKEWRTGHDGSHSCAEYLAARLQRTQAKLFLIQGIQHDDMPEPWRTRICNVLANGVDAEKP